MSTKIHLITPVTTKGFRLLDDVRPLEQFDLSISHEVLDTGPPSIECELDEALAIPDTIKKCIKAEKEGADAIVIDCMGDPGVKPAREAVSIPVIGPMEASCYIAAMLGAKFSIVTVLDSVVPMFHKMLKVYGMDDRLATIRVVDIPVLDIEKDLEKTKQLLAQESLDAVKKDGASVIIFGCTGFLGCADNIKAALKCEGLDVPVIDPVPAAVMQAAALVKIQLTHSKLVYQNPRPKTYTGYDINLD